MDLPVGLVFLQSLQEVEQSLFVQLLAENAFIDLGTGGCTSMTDRCFSSKTDSVISARSVYRSFYCA